MRLLQALALTVASVAWTTHAQQQQQPEPPPPAAPGAYKLTVNANLIQLPTLVVDQKEHTVTGLNREDFQISIDGAASFPPAHMRMEGDDPINLAIILDTSGSQRHMLRDIARSLSGLIPSDIHPHDHVSVYAVDCTIVHPVAAASPSAHTLETAVYAAIGDPRLHGPKGESCPKSLKLRDAIATAASALNNLPSRRVLLVISEGTDTGSSLSYDDTAHAVAQSGTAVFAIRDFQFHNNNDNDLATIARSSGGRIDSIDSSVLSKTLQNDFDAIRGRYILEFPAPTNQSQGTHGIAVQVARPHLTARTASVSVSLPDPTDPDVQAAEATPAEFPILVTDHRGAPVPGLTTSDFQITIDHQPPFAPTSSRLEGDDPIHLVVLLDTSGGEEHLLKTIGPALSSLGSNLRPNDTLSIAAVDCLLAQSPPLHNDPAAIEKSTATVLFTPGLDGNNKSCRGAVPLWTSMLALAHKAAQTPGRPVLLVLSEGHDGGGGSSSGRHSSWSDQVDHTTQALLNEGVTVITLRDQVTYASDLNSDDPITLISRLTGGEVNNIRAADLIPALKAALDHIRSRYILLFGAPSTATGPHLIEVAVNRLHVNAFAAGASTTSAPSTQDGPTAIAIDSPAPIAVDAPATGPTQPTAPAGPNAVPQPTTNGAYTLHVFQNSIQFPTLVRSDDQSLLPFLNAADFQISLDDGPLFPPTHARLEGNDPLNLTLLLDTSGDQDKLLQTLASAIAGLVPQSLHANDRISIYAVNCSVAYSLSDAAPNATILQSHITDLLASPALRDDKGKSCRNNVHIRDAIINVANSMRGYPGRRVLILVSSFLDKGSKATPTDLNRFLASTGVAIFGLQDSSTIHGGEGRYFIDFLSSLAKDSGGKSYNISPAATPQTLQQLLFDVRSRYILDFPLPPGRGGGGFHNIAVTMNRAHLSAHAAGASAPLPDPTTLTDPAAVQGNSSPAVFGNARPTQ